MRVKMDFRLIYPRWSLSVGVTVHQQRGFRERPSWGQLSEGTVGLIERWEACYVEGFTFTHLRLLHL